MSGVEEEIHDFDESEMTMTMEEVVTPLQQEVFTLKAQVADQSGRADAVRAVYNLGQFKERKTRRVALT